MVGKGVQSLQIGEPSDKVAELVKILVVVRNTRYNDVADPYVYMLFIQILRKGSTP